MSLPMKWWISARGRPASSRPHQSSRRPPWARAPLGRGRHVAHRGVEPDIPVLARGVGNLEAEVGGRPGDIPVAERLAEKVPGEVVGDPRIERPGRLGSTPPGSRAGPRSSRTGARPTAPPARLPESVLTGVDQFGRGVGGPALLAGVAVLVGRAALRAGALHEPVGEKHARLGIEQLLHVPGDHEAPLPAEPARARRRAAGWPGCRWSRSGRRRSGSRRSRPGGPPASPRSAPARCGPRPGPGS